MSEDKTLKEEVIVAGDQTVPLSATSEEKTLREEVIVADGPTALPSAMSEEKTLREKVFEVCDHLSLEKKKITRDAVKDRTKRGSDRDLSKYIAEWKAEKETAITVASHSELSQQQQESVAIRQDTVPNSVPNEAYSDSPDNDLLKVARRGAERAATLLGGEDAVVLHLLENPDQLPQDLRERVEAVKGRLNQSIEQRQKQYDMDFFIEKAIAQFQ